jgi:hypothetical protein
MNLLLLLALAIPLSCLALLVSLALLGVLTLGGVIRLIGEVGRSGIAQTRRQNNEPAVDPAAKAGLSGATRNLPPAMCIVAAAPGGEAGGEEEWSK